MLKNKFSVLKSIALALVLVMAVAVFAACGDKGDDSAVSSALEELSKQAYESSVELSKQQSIQDASIKAAAEEQSKKLEEQSKKLAEESKKASEEQAKKDAEASKKLSSVIASIDQSNKDAATATTAPGAAEDLSTLMSELAELRAKYQYAYADYYIGDNHAKVIKVLDLATYQLGNAKTLAAGKDILAQAKVDLAAIENAVTVANAFNAQVEALGDIEADVFTTAAEKVNAARKAYNKFVKDYTSAKVTSSAWVKELGLAATVADLNKAELKLDALAEYIADSLEKDMGALYVASGKKVREPRDINGVITTTAVTYKFGANDSKSVDVAANTTYAKLIASAYYKYQVLSAVNGGSTVDADLAIDWENQLDENGKKTGKVDADKPTEFFTTEDLVEYYILPWAEGQFEVFKNTWLTALTTKANDNTVEDKLLNNDNKYMLASTKVGTVTIQKADLFKGVNVDTRDVVNAFEDELDALTFAKDFKASSTLEEANYALFVRAALAYVNAVNEAVNNLKEAALENASDKVDDAIRGLDEDRPVEAAKIANLQAAITEFTAKVNATKGYDSTTIFDDAVIAAYRSAAKNKNLKDLATILEGATDLNAAFDQVVAYVNNVEALAIANGFKGVTGGGSGYDTSDAELKELVLAMIDDLNLFKENYGEEGKYYTNDLRGAQVPFSADEDDLHVNDEKLVALAKSVDEYIEKLKALKPEDYKTEKVAMTTSKEKEIGSAKKGSAIYFVSEAAYNKAVAETLWVDETEYDYDALLAGKYLTTSKTKFPLQYTYTAGEHAMVEANKIYNAALKDFAAQLISIKGYVNTYTNNETSGLKTKAFKSLQTATAGTALNTELSDLLAKYTSDISKVGAAEVKAVVKNDSPSAKGDHVAMPNSVSYGGATMNYKDFEQSMQKIVASFTTNADTKYNNLIDLWDYKVAQVEAVKAKIEAVKATYAMIKDSSTAVVTEKKVMAVKATATEYGFESTVAVPGRNYIGITGVAYDITSATPAAPTADNIPDAKDAAYEAALDKLVADYETKIMAVTMKGAALEVKNWNGKAIAKTGATWGLADAKAKVNLYVWDILGASYEIKDGSTTKTGSTKYTTVSDGTGTLVTSSYVDSRVFKTWFDTFATKNVYTTKTLG